jgi:hypothetical protein
MTIPATPIAYIRSSVDAERFYTGLNDLLIAAFPDRVASVYLLSSRADGTAIATSDVDVAVVFKASIASDERRTIKTVLDAVQNISPVMLDVVVTSEREIERGIAPTLQQYRLLSGPDLLKDRPLRPRSELMLFYAGLVVHFIQAIRREQGSIRFPLSYPRDALGYCGYERFGTRTADGEYAPGLNILVTLVLAIASYRLAARAEIYTAAKSQTIPNYQKHLPGDPWLPMFVELRTVGRDKLAGRLPPEGPDRNRLQYWCPRVLELENEFLSEVILSLESWLPVEDPGYRRQLVEFVNALDCASAVHRATVERLKLRLACTA